MMLTHCHQLCKPVSIMILVNLALAFVNLLLKKVLNEGMDYMSIITYRQAISFIFMAPIACIYERQEPISFIITLFYLYSQPYLEEKKINICLWLIFLPSFCYHVYKSFGDTNFLLGLSKFYKWQDKPLSTFYRKYKLEVHIISLLFLSALLG